MFTDDLVEVTRRQGHPKRMVSAIGRRTVSAIEPFGSLIEAHLDELVEVLKTEQGMLTQW